MPLWDTVPRPYRTSSEQESTLTLKSSTTIGICAAFVIALIGIAVQRSIAQSAAVLSADATHPCVFASVSGATVSTALGQCSAPTADPASIDHFEADLRDGSFVVHETDLVPYDFSAVPLVRAYASHDQLPQETDGTVRPAAFGLHTGSSFDGRYVEAKTLSQQGKGEQQEFRSPRGSFVRLAYDSRSRISEADDNRNHTARYFYGSDGMLCYAFSPSGAVRHYLYDGTLMTAVEDGDHRTLVRNVYTSGHLTAQTFANGDIYRYAYTWLPNQTLARSVTVTLPDHSKKLISFADPSLVTVGSR
jgi:YD repeat-containing protein